MRYFILNRIDEEIKTLKEDPKYWGSEEQIHISNEIFELSKILEYINQDWIDDRLKFSDEERLEDLQKEIIKGFF